MMKIGFALVVMVGCGAKPAEPLEKPTPLAPNELQLSTPVPSHTVPSFAGSGDLAPETAVAMIPRPALETLLEPPDVAELGRWPLTIAEHPALEPHFDIAAALAAPGITWTDLCARGAQNRHLATQQELVTYLDAWCSVIPGHYGSAIATLGSVRHASNRRLVEALRLDVAAIVAAHGPAHDLESFLRAGGFLDVAHVDLASAAYFEVGKLDDAVEANRLAEEMESSPTESVRCTRMLREVADTTDGAREGALAQLRLAAIVPANDVRTPYCRAEYDMARCWKDGDCAAYWATLVPSADAPGVVYLGGVYEAWSTFRRSSEWLRAAEELASARPLRDRFTLLVPALDASIRLSRCNRTLVAGLEEVIQESLDDLAAQPPKKPSLSIRQSYEANLTKQELQQIPARDVARWQRQLRTALAQVQALWNFDDAGCEKYIAALPPVQP